MRALHSFLVVAVLAIAISASGSTPATGYTDAEELETTLRLLERRIRKTTA